MSTAPKLAAILIAGWIAQALASTDADVDAGVEAYERGDFEEALGRFDAARDRLGERPEIAFDRGLVLLRLEKVEEARTAFERATEADDDALRASALYELGNLEFDAEAYEPAIARYIEALKANPVHANAKWNLELALQKKKEQEEEQEEEENEDESENEDDSENEEEQDEEEQKEDEQEEDEQDEQEEDGQEEEEQGEDEQEEQGEDEQKEDEQDEQEQGQQDDEEQKDDSEPQPAEPEPVDRMDMKRALEELDAQDPFTLDRPQGGYVAPEQDW